MNILLKYVYMINIYIICIIEFIYIFKKKMYSYVNSFIFFLCVWWYLKSRCLVNKYFVYILYIVEVLYLSFLVLYVYMCFKLEYILK